MKEIQNNRLLWADVFKGFGIIAVVLGHVFEGDLHDFIFSFHMPLFFFIGGYFFKPTSNYTLYFKTQFKRLMIPYFSFLLLIVFSAKLVAGVNVFDINVLKGMFVKILFGGRLLVSYAGVFWFVTCYYFTQQVSNILFDRFSDKILILISMLSLILSFINAYFFSHLLVPFNVNVVFASFPFFLFGFLVKKWHFRLNNSTLFFSFLVALSLVLFLENNTYDMKYAIYGIPFVTFICSSIIILAIRRCSKILSKYRFSHYIGHLGKASLVIMYLHQPLHVLSVEFITESKFIVFVMAITLSYIFYHLLLMNTFTRVIFLGISKVKRKH